MKGLGKIKLKNHTVILGWRSETSNLIQEIHGDKSQKEAIVLCTSNFEENPIEGIQFIKGEMSSEDVFLRSNIKQASKIYINAKDDDKTIVTTMAVRGINKTARIVIFMSNEDNIGLLKMSGIQNVSIIKSIYHSLMVQEMQDFGVGSAIEELASNWGEKTMYRIEVPLAYQGKVSEVFNILKDANVSSVMAIHDTDEKRIWCNEGELENQADIKVKAVFVITRQRPEINWPN